MNRDKVVTGYISRLVERSEYSYYTKGYLGDNESSETFERRRLRGEIYFDDPIFINNEDHNYYGNYNELGIGTVDFFVSEEEYTEGSICVDQERYGEYQLDTRRVNATVCCTEQVFIKLKEAQQNGAQVSIQLSSLNWLDSDGRYPSCKFKLQEIEIHTDRIKDKYWFEEYRERYIRGFLLWRVCGDHASGQVYEICKELSKGFRDEIAFDKRSETLEKIIELISSLRFRLQTSKSDLYQRIIQSSMESDSSSKGISFCEEANKITDKEEKRKVLQEHNHLWKRIDIYRIFEDGFSWMEEFDYLAEEYLKCEGINTSTLNLILIDGLITTDIANTAWRYQIENKLTGEAIRSVKKGEYNFLDILKDKSFSAILLEGVIATWVGYLFSGVTIWWLTSFISGNNELAHYTLFGTVFSASVITLALYKIEEMRKKTPYKEEKYFQVLKDMRDLHKQSEFMNSNLLKHLMYKLEERGIQMNHNIYKILEKH